MKRIFGLMIAAAGLVLASCSDDAETISGSVVFEDDISSAATADAIFDDIDDITEINDDGFGAKSFDPERERMNNCATITVDREAGEVVIDFGDGCEGRDGRVRAGIIRITHSGEYGQPGHTKVTTFEDFSVDSIAVEGIRTITDISDTALVEKKYSITLVGGKLTFPDGTEVTRDAEKIRRKFFNEEEQTRQATVFGIATGINKDGLQYTHTVDEATPLLFSHACRDISKLAPISGILLIQVEGESDKIIDFGDGTCDNLVTVTQDGMTTEIEIDPRQTRRRHHRNRR